MKQRRISWRPMAQVFVALWLCANAAAATPPAPAAGADAAFSEAMEQYRDGRWSAAYGRFARLADQGHVEASRVALLMFRHGAKLYGAEWGASQPQIDLWTRLALIPMQALVSESGD